MQDYSVLFRKTDKDASYIAAVRSVFIENYLFEMKDYLAEWKQKLAKISNFYDEIQITKKNDLSP